MLLALQGAYQVFDRLFSLRRLVFEGLHRVQLVSVLIVGFEEVFLKLTYFVQVFLLEGPLQDGSWHENVVAELSWLELPRVPT